LFSGEPLWKPEHLQAILNDYGIVTLDRHNASPLITLSKLPIPRELDANLIVINDEAFPNQLSSTLLRAALKEGRSIRYCTPDPVVQYISENSLYAQ
jgi:nicotinic acid mononucleotide adenylyltransferase